MPLPSVEPPSAISMDSLHPRQNNVDDDTASSISGGQPPAHFVHSHDSNNPHFYEGTEPGNAGNPVGHSTHHPPQNQHQQRHGHGREPSGGWGQYDTYIDEKRNHSRPQVQTGTTDDSDDQLPSPHAPFAQHPGGGAAGGNGKHHHSQSIASSLTGTDDETDDFDWETSGSEDSDEEEGTGKKTAIRAKRGRKIYLGCLRLARPVRLLLTGVIGSAICMVPFIVMTFSFQNDPVRPQVVVWSIWLAIIWAAAVGTFLLLDFIPPLAIKLAIAVYGRAPEIFKTYVELFMATILYIKLVLCIAWAWISLGGVLAIQFSSTTRPSYFRWIFFTIQALFGTSIILLVEKLALQLVAINFHKEAMKDRLETNQKSLKALDKLHDSKYLAEKTRDGRRTPNAWRTHFGMGGGSKPPSPGPNALGGSSQGHASKASRDGLGGYFATENGGEGSASPETEKQHRQGYHQTESGVALPDENTHAARKAARKANFATQLSDALAMATMKDSKIYKGRSLGSQQSARKLAKKLFTNLSITHPNRKTLLAEDFVPYFKSNQEAIEAFQLFDADGNGDISKSEMREAVQRIYRERRALSTSMKDMSSAIKKLDGVLMGLGLIIVVFIWLLIFNRDSTVANIVPLSTFVVGFSFVFGNSAKNIFESMIFIFATHPYDVGDLVCIDDSWMFVTDFGLLSTTFKTTVGQIVVAPNALLASSKYIHNARRSGSQWEVTTIMTSFETAIQTIDEFRKRLRAWVKENDREWGGGLDVNYDSIENMNCVSLVIAMEHKGNWQDWGARWARRTKLMRQVKTVCEELGMEYSLPPQPVSFHPKSGSSPFKTGRFNFNNGRGPGGNNSLSPTSPVPGSGSGSGAGFSGGTGMSFGAASRGVPFTASTPARDS